MQPLHGGTLPYRFHHLRSFIAARVKWVRDPYLDTTVSKEKDLKQVISFKNQIISSPSKYLSLSSLSLLKSHFDLLNITQKLFEKYPSLFTQYQPSPSLPLHVKITHQALSVHREEQAIYTSLNYRDDAVKRLS